MADKSVTEAINNLETEIKSTVDARDEALRAEFKSQIDALVKAAGRPSNVSTGEEAEAEYKSAFEHWARTGDASKVAEFKTMSGSAAPGTGTNGGVTIPKVIYNQIQKQLQDVSAMRSVARVLSVSTPDFRIPFSTGGTSSAWVGETDTRPATNTSSIVQIQPSFGELTLAPVASLQLIEDSQFDIAGYIAGEMATEIDRATGAAFLNGTGTNQPLGLLNPTGGFAATADKTRAFGVVQALTSSNTAAFTADDLIALTGALKAGFRKNGTWLMTKATKTLLRGFKDSMGQYLFQPSLVAGNPDVLMGYPIVEMEDMPEVATGNYAVAFGDFSAGYTVADLRDIQMLYNPYVTPGFVTWQSRMRVGGCPVDTQAYKVLKIK